MPNPDTVYRTKFFNIRIGGQFKFASGGLGPYVKISNRRYAKNDGTTARVTDLNTRVLEWPTYHGA